MNFLEYLNENGLKKYPFTDSATLRATNGITIPSDLFVDAGLYPETGKLRWRLVEMSKNNTNLVLTFEWVSENEDTGVMPPLTISINEVEILLAKQFSIEGMSGFITFGRGLTTLPSNHYYFDDATNFICDSRVIDLFPSVTSITASNFDLGGNTDEIIATASDLTLVEGSNVQWVVQAGQEQLNVAARAGTGLYNPCIPISAVRTINNIATVDGSFFFASDSCQRITYPDAHALYIENLCSAGCSADSIEASAYYINRVNDGVTQLVESVKEFRDGLSAQIDQYLSVTIPQRETPYYVNTIAKYGNGKASSGTQANYTYFTMRAYVYNPSTTPTIVVASGTTSSRGEVVGIYYLDRNGESIMTNIPATPPSFCDTSSTPCRQFIVGCKSFVVVKFTVRVLNPAFGRNMVDVSIDTSLGSHTYNEKTGL